MSVIRQSAWYGSARIDAPFLRAQESGVCGDFDLLAGSMIAGKSPLVVSGYTLSTFAIGVPPETLNLVVAGATSLHYGASASGTLFSVPMDRPPETLSPVNPRVSGSFSASSVNFVGIDIQRSPDASTEDFVTFLDPKANKEIQRQVPLALTLDYIIHISTLPFPETSVLLPLLIVVTDTFGLVASIQDARPMLGRLGSGGDQPDVLHGYDWPQGRQESTTNPFQGGDKAIDSLKAWMDATMTRVWEIGGGERWSSAVSDRNVRFCQAGATFTGGEYFEWDGINLHWKGLSFVLPNSTGYLNAIADQTTDLAGLTNLADGDCLYVDLDYGADHSGAGALTMVRAPLHFLGAPIPSRSRAVVAWRKGIYVFTRDSYFAVGQNLGIADRDVASSVPIYQRALIECQTSPMITVQPLGSVFVTEGGAWVRITDAVAMPIDVSLLIGLGVSARYYLYVKSVLGVLTYEVSTTPPDGSLRYKAGGTTSAFVGTFSTNSLSAVIPFKAQAGRYRYTNSPNSDLNLQALAGGAATVVTTVGYGAQQAPPQASEVRIAATTNTIAANRLYVASVSGGAMFDLEVDAGKSPSASWDVPVSPAGLGFEYHWQFATGSAAVFVLGFNL